MYSKEEIAQAQKRVKKKKEFYNHLISFVTVNTGLFFLNLITSFSHPWFLYPLLGWGMGLMFHYVDVFGIPGFGMLDKEWEQRELDNELRRTSGSKTPLPRLEDGPKEQELKLKELRKNYNESDLV